MGVELVRVQGCGLELVMVLGEVQWEAKPVKY